MKLISLSLVIFMALGVNAGITRKQPQYSKPIYSNSYLPAAMQVIFYAVDQIRNFPPEEGELSSSTTLPTTLPHAPGQHQPPPGSPTPLPVLLLAQTERPLEKPPQATVIVESPIITSSTPALEQKPELSEETPEAVYGTPETNHETPEASQEIQEANHEAPVTPSPQDDPTSPIDGLATDQGSAGAPPEASTMETTDKNTGKGHGDPGKRGEPTIESVVREIYGIVKENRSKDSSGSRESTGGKRSDEDSGENEGEEYHQNRFTMIGEKVVQVPRPSLLAYLKRARITIRCSLEQLAILYDALSKDARRQGFVKFSGYTDEVLRTLETSAEGGIGPQLQRLLEKIVERKEVTRDDTKAKITEALKDLKEPGSNLNSDLRRLLPLKFKI
ncbi:uncharacterized protein LOC135167836 [Diachasmimorpha longicaudata]|uniref:uncharacterized protein LOC135167836 n=1 Tax=Diachasmimorpha longicaudata TaxID=58733 RepID=UPI0030B89301